MDCRRLWFPLLWLVSCCRGARILGIFPTPSISHQLPFQMIMKALAARGHEITVISPEPLKKRVANYTDVDLSFSYEYFRSSFDFATMDQVSAYDFLNQMIPVLEKLTEDQLNSSVLQQFIRSNTDKYDVVFLEALLFQSYHGLVHHLGSPPLIGVLSLQCFWNAGEEVGTPVNPSFMPEMLLSYGSHMTFYERFQNTMFWIWIRYKMQTHVLPRQEAIMRKYFGQGPPPVTVAESQMSLLMQSTNWIFSYPVPTVPAVISFHSLHVKTSPDPLPKDLQKYLDEAEDGVIYFSLGSNVRSDRMPEEKRHVFIDAFSELSLKVLWKWESDSLPGQPANVRLGKWLPQQDILAHPNVKLFITQCGLQSFQEAVYHAVPLVGIPFFADQKYNAKKIATAEVGLELSFNELTKDTLLDAINTVLDNPRYRDNMKNMSAVSKDEPQASLDKAVWWTEYVIRHKGAKHLRSASLDLTWYQYLLLDIIAVLLLIAFIAVLVLYFILRTIYKFFTRQTKPKHD